MVDFAKADICTDPSPLIITLAPTPSGSTIQMQLQPLPSFNITFSKDPSDSGWQKFNTDLLKPVADTLIPIIQPFITSTIKSKAQDYLNQNASFPVPSIPITFDGISIKLTPTNLAITTSGTDYVLITGNVSIG